MTAGSPFWPLGPTSPCDILEVHIVRWHKNLCLVFLPLIVADSDYGYIKGEQSVGKIIMQKEEKSLNQRKNTTNSYVFSIKSKQARRTLFSHISFSAVASVSSRVPSQSLFSRMSGDSINSREPRYTSRALVFS